MGNMIYTNELKPLQVYKYLVANEAKKLKEQGKTIKKIAQHFKVCEKTVRNWLK